ncbi:histidinol-phosphate transaminase [Bythopirellula goksoeyrii]|uniref:histidinol-phosphate transaminase n=1 Tax=Bythopirellula goksoeyrii TaxID=1400387 RepID=UPI0021BCA873|nr:histidinol-phosphate transaminase [Bythopirellula goksoeyrii]
MEYVRSNIQAMDGYTPGEQPQGGKFIKLNTNENPYPCSPKVKAAIGRVCQTGLQRYPDPAATAFRRQLCELLTGELPDISPEWILCGNGSDDILTIITRTFVDTGDVIRYPNPSYVLYKSLADIQGAEVDVANYQSDWSLPPEFSEPQDRLKLALLANPNSPSGTIVPAAAVAEIADALPCPLVVDEAYVDFADANCLALVAENEKIMVTRTLSKSYALAGLRFGYVVAQPQIISELAKVKDSYNCDALSIAGATAAIEDQAWLAENRAAILATRERLTNELRSLGFECVDSQANFVWCRHPRHDSAQLYRDLKSVGVLVRYMNYPHWGEGLRITVGTDDQIEAFLAILHPLLH